METVDEALRVRELVLRIESDLMLSMGQFLRGEGFVEILPVIISPITDPLNHSVVDAKIEYYGGFYSLTKSMIFHKQLSLEVTPRIFSFSPNVRLETADRATSGKHLIEFTQLDLEVRDASRDDILSLVERMFVQAFSTVGQKFGDEIVKLNPRFAIPSVPFERVRYTNAIDKFGGDFESILSKDATNPFWLIDIPIFEREFYDKLNDDGETLADMDLIYPFGFGEGISGGERENEYDKIVQRMRRKGNSLDDFEWYLEKAKSGLPRSAGCGIGIERLTRFICGLDSVKDARLFAKLPGKISL
ncbi:MAG: asparagine synthetase A [Caldisericaceae bacterium]